jgi:hypothetical protein
VEVFEQQVNYALQVLQQSHLPPGLAGFVVFLPPIQRSLARQHGILQYDLIYAVEQFVVQVATTREELELQLWQRMKTQQPFRVSVYSFQRRQHRRVKIVPPIGVLNPLLELDLKKLPIMQEKRSEEH